MIKKEPAEKPKSNKRLRLSLIKPVSSNYVLQNFLIPALSVTSCRSLYTGIMVLNKLSVQKIYLFCITYDSLL